MSGEKTEQPTPKRLREARKKGQVAYSRDISGAATLIALFAYVGISFNYYLQELQGLVGYIAGLNSPVYRDAVNAGLKATAITLLKLSLPPVLVAAAVGLAAGYAQVGGLLAFEALKPDLNKLNPAQGIKKIFGMKNLIEFLKNIIKLSFVGYLVYHVIRQSVPDLVTFAYGEVDAILPALGVLVKRIAVNAAFAFIVIAAADGFLQRRQLMKQLKMTREEVKQEYKEMEGSPEIKGKRRQLHRELLAGDPAESAKQATAVVTNPVHLAVALYYKAGETPLPRVTAKGDGAVALRMRRTAERHGVPVMENVELARALYRDAEVDDFIPADLIEPVAEVLRWAHELDARRRS